MAPNVVDLPEDCLLAAFLYLGPRTVVACGRLCRRFRQIIDHPSLWRFSLVSGHAIEATNIIKHALTPRASMIKGLGFVNITLLTDVVLPDTEAGITLRHNLFTSIDELLKATGPHLESLHVEDSTHELSVLDSFSDAISLRSKVPYQAPMGLNTTNFLIEAQTFFASVAQYCSSLIRISVMVPTLSTGRSEAINILMMLTNCCPKVKEFRDDDGVLLGSGLDGYGGSLTPSAAATAGLRHMVDGWKDLKSLEISTTVLSVAEFAESLRLFGSRLHNLSISHFRDSLSGTRVAWNEDSQNAGSGFDALVSSLSRLTELEVLAFDLSMTTHRDGLSAVALEKILTACPKLKGFEYYAPYDAYYEDEDDYFNDGVSFFGGGRSGALGNAFSEDNSSSLGIDWRYGRKSNAAFNPAVESIMTRSRRGSAGSASLMTVNTGYYYGHGGGATQQERNIGSMSVLSRDDDERDEDVTSLAPGLPSPNPLGNQKIDIYGTWVPEDVKTIRQRAEEDLLNYGRFLSKKQFDFFGILEDIAGLCKQYNVRVTIAWAL
ncbi:hypothetical protein HDU67_009421 [Dinochytrium kinnereticum]|nr:hypothetical protein HDU67_009421 [Dinochytrium kinnereticum]